MSEPASEHQETAFSTPELQELEFEDLDIPEIGLAELELPDKDFQELMREVLDLPEQDCQEQETIVSNVVESTQPSEKMEVSKPELTSTLPMKTLTWRHTKEEAGYANVVYSTLAAKWYGTDEAHNRFREVLASRSKESPCLTVPRTTDGRVQVRRIIYNSIIVLLILKS